VLVFAAASTAQALHEALESDASVTDVEINAAGSSTLARQIAEGAPADLFLSADEEWMDWLDARGLIEPGTRRDLLGNRLVMVTPAARRPEVRFEPNFDIGAHLSGCLALAQVDAVPAGRYARRVLDALGWWSRLSSRVVETADVRAALALVERAECGAAIVYATDAAASSRVATVEIPVRLQPQIVYPVAIVRGHADARVRRVYERLLGVQAAAVLRAFGFSLLGTGREHERGAGA